MVTQKTSLDTYYKIKSEGLLPEKRMRIYEIFYQQGNLTGSQVAQFYKNKYPTNQHSETIRNRITELVQMKVIEELGTTNCPLSNREVILYGLNANLPSKIPVKKTKKQKVDDIKLVVQKGLDFSQHDMFGEPYKEFLTEIMNKLNTI